jgi:hypothetical protein
MQIISRLYATALLLVAPLAFASSPAMDAANAKAAVPAVEYESVLSGYISRQVGEPGDWKEANASAGSGGGHGAHGSHMVQPGMEPSMPEAPAGNNNPHAGHQH